MKIGITGHQRLDDPAWVKREILALLPARPRELAGITSLAVGADQLFAQAVLERGGSLHVVVPFEEYADVFTVEGRREYERLLALATTVEVLTVGGSREDGFLAAGKRVVDLSTFVLAVWNGEPAAGLGGTGNIVHYARECHKPGVQLNPVTRQCTSLT